MAADLTCSVADASDGDHDQSAQRRCLSNERFAGTQAAFFLPYGRHLHQRHDSKLWSTQSVRLAEDDTGKESRGVRHSSFYHLLSPSARHGVGDKAAVVDGGAVIIRASFGLMYCQSDDGQCWRR